jgi:hypothetical protein
VLILLSLLIEAITALTKTGISVHTLQPSPAGNDLEWDALLAVTAGDAQARFAVETKSRAPYPNELSRLDDTRRMVLARGAQPLLVVPFVPEPLGTLLTSAGWSWADEQGNFDLRAPGMMLRQRRTTAAPPPRRRGFPQGSGSLGIVRALIRLSRGEDEQPSATALAGQAKVSQPRASQVLAQLRELGLVQRSPQGRWTPDRDALLDRFLAEYRGPGGSESYFYSLDAPTHVAVSAARAEAGEAAVAISADVGPDLLVAWRRPTVVVLYAPHPIDEETLGLVEAQGRHDANVIVRHPTDRSVFRDPPLVVQVDDVDVQLADEAQLIWDLQELGGADRLEAAGVLREWLLTGH